MINEAQHEPPGAPWERHAEALHRPRVAARHNCRGLRTFFGREHVVSWVALARDRVLCAIAFLVVGLAFSVVGLAVGQRDGRPQLRLRPACDCERARRSERPTP